MSLYTSLVAFWELSEVSGNRADSIGTHTLTDVNTVGSTTGLVYALAANLVAASSERFTSPDVATLQTGDVDFWVGAWFRLATNVTGHLIGRWRSTADNREYVLYYDSATAKLTFYVADSGATVASIAQSGTLATATWYFALAWHDSVANTINLQISGGTVASLAHTGGVDVSNLSLEIGAAAATGFFNGRIGPAMFGKGDVPTANKGAWLYNAGAGRTLAAMAVADALAGAVAGTSTVTGTLVADGRLAGNTSGSAVVSAILQAAGFLEGSTSGSSTVSAIVVGITELVGSTGGIAIATAIITANGGLQAVVSGVATVTATISATTALAGTSAGVATTVAIAVGIGNLSSTIGGTSVVVGVIMALGSLSGSIIGSSTVTGNFNDGEVVVDFGVVFKKMYAGMHKGLR